MQIIVLTVFDALCDVSESKTYTRVFFSDYSTGAARQSYIRLCGIAIFPAINIYGLVRFVLQSMLTCMYRRYYYRLLLFLCGFIGLLHFIDLRFIKLGG